MHYRWRSLPQGQWVTDAHHAAYALDPRVRAAFQAPADDGAAWTQQRELWQASVVRARRWVQGYLSAYPDRAAALNAAFEEYVAWEGLFQECPLPPADCDVARAIAWWRNEQPSLVLGQVAEHLFSMRASQGAAERAWAALSRQCSPIRARLSSAKKRQLLNVLYNGRMAITGQPSSVQPAKRFRRIRSDDSLAAEARLAHVLLILSDVGRCGRQASRPALNYLLCFASPETASPTAAHLFQCFQSKRPPQRPTTIL
jgi:hypothetical protein